MTNQPTPQEIKEARIKAGLTLREAGNLVGIKKQQHWQRFETDGKSNRPIPLHKWELFLLKIKDIK